MEDGHTLFDYDVGLNDIVQLMIRVNMPELAGPSVASNGEEKDKEENDPSTSEDDNNVRFFLQEPVVGKVDSAIHRIMIFSNFLNTFSSWYDSKG